MAIYDGDQQTTTYGVVNGAITAMTPATVKALATGGTTAYRFTAPFSVHHKGQDEPIHFRRGLTYLLDPALKATLLALSAPMVAV